MMESQVENAIEIAWNPASDPSLKEQAFQFLTQIREDFTAWQTCLSLFTAEPRRSEIVRHFCLEIVNNSVSAGHLDAQSLEYVKNSLLDYIRRTIGGASGATVDTAHIQNKVTQTLTYMFAALYPTTWQSFFDDFRALAGDASAIGTDNVTATTFYLRILCSVHDEIADQLVPRTPEENARNTELKDLVRARDTSGIATSWQEILSKWQQIEPSITELVLKTVSRWVSWVDIALVVNESMIGVLLQMAGQQITGPPDSPPARVRDSAIDTLTETVGKKMRPPEKVQLLSVLNLGNVVGELVRSKPLAEDRYKPTYDTDLAEAVAKLVNTAMTDIVKVLDNKNADQETKARADEQLQLFMPYLLRFFSDEYDEVCSQVLSSLDDLLTYFRKIVQANPSNPATLPPAYFSFLEPTLDAIIAKSKYDETASWGEEDERTDEAEFQDLRKRLHTLQLIIAVVDENLYMNVLTNVVATTFNKANAANLDWRELELALYEMYLFGELAVKNGGLYAKKAPSSIAAERLVEMMTKMVQSDIASYSHPAVQIMYMDICIRYCQFFEHNPTLVPRVLENFVRLTHSDHLKVRTRSWYLFLRFVKPLRSSLGNVSSDVIRAIGDLLVIKAELPDDDADGEMSSDESEDNDDARFDSQLNLFEAVGCLSSAASVPVETRKLYAQSIINPLFTDIENHLGPARGGDKRAILQIHHDIMALGTLAKGFSDWQPTLQGPPAPSEVGVGDEFERASEAILAALEALKSSMEIRSAARFAFARAIGVLNIRVLQQLPRWIDGLLSPNSTNDEMVTFLRLLGQVIYQFKGEIQGILDTLLSPLLQRIFAGLQEPVTGTDDEIQLVELGREYLNFLLLVLNSDLGGIFISSTNQSSFETIITSVEHFARSSTDYPNARLALSTLTRMGAVWGGPDVPFTDPSATPNPSIIGFDSFVLTRFSPLAWALPADPNFRTRDPLARQVMNEVALMQLQILKKTGNQYVGVLRGQLESMGVGEEGREEYLRALGTGDERTFRNYFWNFIQKARAG